VGTARPLVFLLLSVAATIGLGQTTKPDDPEQEKYSVIIDGRPAVRFYSPTHLEDEDIEYRSSSLMSEEALVFNRLVIYSLDGKGGVMFGASPKDRGSYRCLCDILVSKERFGIRSHAGSTLGTTDVAYTTKLASLVGAQLEKKKGVVTVKLEFNIDGQKNTLLVMLRSDNTDLLDLVMAVFSKRDEGLQKFEFWSTDARAKLASRVRKTFDVELYAKFYNYRRTDPDSAYKAAMEFVSKYPDDEWTKAINAWLAAYRKVKEDKSKIQ
jgi:hypothetical protein